MKKLTYLLLVAAIAGTVWFVVWPSLKWRFVRQRFDFPPSIVWGQYCRTIGKDGKSSYFTQLSMVDDGKWRVEVKRDRLRAVVTIYDGVKQTGSAPTKSPPESMEPRHDLDLLLRSLSQDLATGREEFGKTECLVYRKTFTPQFATSVWIDERTRFPWHMIIVAEDHKSEARYSIFRLGFHDPAFFDASNNGTALFAAFGKEVEALQSRSD